METTNDLLDRIKAKHGLRSDYALAGLLGMSRERISRYRNTNGQLGDDAAVRVAELLDIDVGYVLACAAHERAKSDAARDAWERLAELVKRHGVAAGLAILTVAPAVRDAAVCILCQVARRVASSLARGCRFLRHGTAPL